MPDNNNAEKVHRLTKRDERRIRSVILEWLNEWSDGSEPLSSAASRELANKIAANLVPTIEQGDAFRACPVEVREGDDDSPGCPSATDFATDTGLVLITRCRKPMGHLGKRHSDGRAKQWTDAEATWHVTPPVRSTPPVEREIPEVAPCWGCVGKCSFCTVATSAQPRRQWPQSPCGLPTECAEGHEGVCTALVDTPEVLPDNGEWNPAFCRTCGYLDCECPVPASTPPASGGVR